MARRRAERDELGIGRQNAMKDAVGGVPALEIGLAETEPLEIDILVEAGDWPSETALAVLARQAIAAVFAETGVQPAPTELSLVFTDDAHIRTLNAGWRDNDKPTNVLSFPAFPPRRGGALPPMLGDIILAAETIAREATLEEKPFEHHLTHLIVHGLLHLMGYDHETEAEAEEMEAVERRALARLAIPDPYA
jgi:probable rRNA maturation factor